MSEIPNSELSRAEQFQALHVYRSTDDYETYQREMLYQWKENAEDALEAGESIRPLWLRRTGDMGSEFGVMIDYVMPFSDGLRYFASIDIDGTGGQTDISVQMPDEDGSDEPAVVMSEAYTLPALQRAVEYVESQVQPFVQER